MHITVDILSDTICPWCYIGKRRLEAALASVDTAVTAELRWHPFQLNPDMPAGGMSRKRYVALKFGGSERGRSIYRNIADVAQTSGLEIDFDRITRTPNTLDSHRLLVHAQRANLQNEVVEALFAAYFLEGRDIGAVDVLTDIGEAAGLGRTETERYLLSDADRAQVIESDTRARGAGASGVPHFVINGKLAVAGAQEPQVFRNVFAVVLARSEHRA
ncbi:MAG: DsbA family oxidoreductase [Rhodospirillales bacterium]|nr:DsbA family oxidoreductase [Rhodospirillales bacterium]MDE0712081.1 DsbA family oxidoreductase [Rhodospirillales bacterium]